MTPLYVRSRLIKIIKVYNDLYDNSKCHIASLMTKLLAQSSEDYYNPQLNVILYRGSFIMISLTITNALYNDYTLFLTS